MQRLLTTRTVSMVDMREPGKVLAEANGEPVAVLKNNKCVGYFVPVERVADIATEGFSAAELEQLLVDRLRQTQPVLDYLKDK